MRAVERHSYRAGNAAVRASMTNFLRHVGALISLGLGLVLACAANAVAQQTIWPSTSVPATVDSGSSGPVELGVSFTADTSGTVTAIRFYKSAANTGLHAGHLWSRTGALLATVTFTGETSSGWQQANFSTPVAITAKTVYVASYQTTIGHWSVNWNYFATSGVNNPPLHALQNGNGAPDGVWGVVGTYPTHTNSSNYWVDVVFSAAGAPSITAQPASQTVTAGQTATFSVAATGTAPLTYQWNKNNLAISGANLPSYTTTPATSSDNGAQFTVTISNAAGTITSNPATLTVNVPPSITAQPASQTVMAGQPATFSVSVSGTAPLSYQWQKNGTVLSGATSSTYTTLPTTTSDDGARFTVTVTNSAGSVTSSAATLTVTPLLPTAAYGFNEGSGNTTIDASGNGNAGTLSGPSWTTNGRYGNALSLNGTNVYVEVANSSSLNPGTTATFSAWVNMVAANADISSVIGKWSQTIDDEYLFGLDSSNRLIFAWQTTGGNTWGQPSFNIVSGSAQVPLGTWTYITVLRNGPAISFYVNGNLDAKFNTADANPFRNGINTLRIGGQNRGGTPRFLNGIIDEVRMYNQALTPAQIQADMNTAISTLPGAPLITIQPTSQTVIAGQTATFSVTASGTAPLTYQWQENGTAISGASSASYTTPATSTSDNGEQFTVVVSNSAGSVTSSAATLTVNPTPVGPSITKQPTSQTVVAGQTATFSVTASGTPLLSYQWQKNGTAITGASSASYTTPATSMSDTGAQFTVVVSNAAGSVTSSAATLTVNPATRLLSVSSTSLSFGNILSGTNSILGVTLKNIGNSNVTISNVSVSGAGFIASGVPTGTILAPGQTATLNAAFAPVATGILTGSVTVTSDATNSPTTVTLSGVGVVVAPPPPTFPVWVAPSLVRVGKTDAPVTASSITLSSARGETVDTQVIVRGPAGGLSNLNISASALTGPGGASIPASSLTLYREYYLTVTGTASYGGGSNPPLGSGTYPEPLIPFNDPETGAPLCGSAATLKACNASVSAGQNQPYWIDISVPHGPTNSPPGTYTGTVSVTATQGTTTIPVTL